MVSWIPVLGMNRWEITQDCQRAGWLFRLPPSVSNVTAYDLMQLDPSPWLLEISRHRERCGQG
jgi:hypothetical protein